MAIKLSNAVCAASIHDFVRDKFYLHHVRFISVDNHWVRLYPTFPVSPPPEQWDNDIYGALLDGIILLLLTAPIVHLRLAGISLTPDVCHLISRHASIRKLTLDGCDPSPTLFWLATLADMPTLRTTNISYLALGFSVNEASHENLWAVIALCTELVHLFAYPDSPFAVVSYPPDAIWPDLLHVHFLECLHVEGIGLDFDDFSEWMYNAYVVYKRPGTWTKLKLTSAHGIFHADLANCLLQLSDAQPNIQTLIIEGVEETPVQLFALISLACPRLEALAITQLNNVSGAGNSLCDWDSHLGAYAHALQDLRFLRYFSGNFRFTTVWFGWAHCLDAIDELLGAP